MSDFDFEVREKKRTASGARHRVRGGRSKKCSLPSDYMTEAEKRRMNGPVTRYNLNAPMKWSEFKARPVEIQKEYLDSIMMRFGAGSTVVGKDLFGVSANTVAAHMKKIGLRAPVAKRPMTADEKKAWLLWCNGDQVVEPDNVVRQNGPVCEEQMPADTEEVKEEAALEMDSVCIHFVGELTPASFLKALADVRVPTGRCDVRISVRRMPDGV